MPYSILDEQWSCIRGMLPEDIEGLASDEIFLVLKMYRKDFELQVLLKDPKFKAYLEDPEFKTFLKDPDFTIPKNITCQQVLDFIDIIASKREG